MKYNYEHFDRGLLMEDLKFQSGPGPGEPFPEFDLTTAGGGRVRKSDFVGKRPLVMMTGSVTCPMTSSASPLIKQLYDKYRGRVDFLTLYVREAHPGDKYPQPSAFDQKLRHAADYQWRDQIPWRIAIDDLDGTVHQALDAKPNSLHIMDKDGNVAFRSLWANDLAAISDAVDAVASGRTPPEGEREPHVIPLLRGVGHMYDRLEESGDVARRDVRREAPPVYAMARLADLFHPLPPLGRSIAAIATVGLAAAVLIGGTYALLRPGRKEG